jgi:hypothetical protein|tara:strand:- start:652 stop:780 length:129 start_codon:yes stop_codon:yes gene_type:complete
MAAATSLSLSFGGTTLPFFAMMNLSKFQLSLGLPASCERSQT